MTKKTRINCWPLWHSMRHANSNASNHMAHLKTVPFWFSLDILSWNKSWPPPNLSFCFVPQVLLIHIWKLNILDEWTLWKHNLFYKDFFFKCTVHVLKDDYLLCWAHNYFHPGWMEFQFQFPRGTHSLRLLRRLTSKVFHLPTENIFNIIWCDNKLLSSSDIQ